MFACMDYMLLELGSRTLSDALIGTTSTLTSPVTKPETSTKRNDYITVQEIDGFPAQTMSDVQFFLICVQ